MDGATAIAVLRDSALPVGSYLLRCKAGQTDPERLALSLSWKMQDRMAHGRITYFRSSKTVRFVVGARWLLSACARAVCTAQGRSRRRGAVLKRAEILGHGRSAPAPLSPSGRSQQHHCAVARSALGQLHAAGQHRVIVGSRCVWFENALMGERARVVGILAAVAVQACVPIHRGRPPIIQAVVGCIALDRFFFCLNHLFFSSATDLDSNSPSPLAVNKSASSPRKPCVVASFAHRALVQC